MPPAEDVLARRHVTLGWWTLLAFLALGMVLHALYALDAAWYAADAVATRRLMWTLAHAHGALMGLVNVAFGICLPAFPSPRAGARRWASMTLLGATVLFPTGFLLGGLWIADGDPGLGILLVPVGGVLLLVAVTLAAIAARPARPR